MRAAILALVVAAPLAAPGAAQSSATGLRGLVTRGPVTPVCQVNVSCDAPSKHTTLVFTRNGVSKSTVTGDDGRYAIALAAGTYAVRIPAAKFGFKPRSVIVVAGRMSVRNFSIDTGIR